MTAVCGLWGLQAAIFPLDLQVTFNDILIPEIS